MDEFPIARKLENSKDSGTLYTKSQDHESPGPKNSILNPLLDLRRDLYIYIYIGPNF
jgi:hypothetical protein